MGVSRGEGVEPAMAGRQMQWTARSGGDGGGCATPPPETEGTRPGEQENISTVSSFSFTYLLPCGGRREGQRVGLRGGLHRAGGCGSRGAEGRLDHVNGFSVAHLSQGLHQLLYCPPGDL